MKKILTTRKGLTILMSLLFMLTISCKEDSNVILSVAPTIAASEIFSISSNAATVKNSLTSDGGSEITTQGICWATTPMPTINNSIIVGDLNDSIMFCRIEGLTPNTKYYARAYATNSIGTGYGNEITLTTNNTVTDIDENVYNTVTIGSQVWMVENFRATKYNDGIDIPFMNQNSSWAEIDSHGYCWYDNSISNKSLYGALYNWPTVNSEKLCPTGWHIPTDAEWGTLNEYLGGEYVAAEFLKAVGFNWTELTNKANNYSGFSALPGGASGASLGSFSGKGLEGIWWSSKIDYSIGDGAGWNIYWAILENNTVQRNGFMSKAGALNFLSVRCIKN